MNLSQEYVVIECGADGCDQTFAVRERFYNWTKEGHGWFCPRGHPRIWKGQTTVQQLEAAQAREGALRDQLLAAEAEAERRRVQIIRDRHRFANGVCPCCNRSFTNVMRHMETQHPDYDPADLTLPRYRCSCGRDFDTMHGLRVHQGKSRSGEWTDPAKSNWRRHLTEVAY